MITRSGASTLRMSLRHVLCKRARRNLEFIAACDQVTVSRLLLYRLTCPYRTLGNIPVNLGWRISEFVQDLSRIATWDRRRCTQAHWSAR